MEPVAGVYREDQWLVVPLDTSSLPTQCLWTNTPTNETRQFTIIDPKAGYQLDPVFGIRGKMKQRKVRLPVSKEWAGGGDARKLMMSRRMLTFSGPALVLGFAVAVATLAIVPRLDGTPAEAIVIGSVILGTLGLCGTVVGLALPYLEGVPGADLIRVGLITDTHFWLPDAHAAHLAAAPPWNGPSRAEYLAARPSFLQTALKAWIIFFSWLLVIAIVSAIRALVRHAW